MKNIVVTIRYAEVTTVPDDWSKEQIEEYLEDNILYTLPNLGVLEDYDWEIEEEEEEIEWPEYQ